jgi:hypothetical protein
MSVCLGFLSHKYDALLTSCSKFTCTTSSHRNGTLKLLLAVSLELAVSSVPALPGPMISLRTICEPALVIKIVLKLTVT